MENPANVQAHLEREIGRLFVQLVIKDEIIERLTHENTELKAQLGVRNPDNGDGARKE